MDNRVHAQQAAAVFGLFLQKLTAYSLKHGELVAEVTELAIAIDVNIIEAQAAGIMHLNI
jgi:hypothetical protein